MLLKKGNYKVFKGKSGLFCTSIKGFYFFDENRKLVSNKVLDIRIELEPIQLIAEEKTILIFDKNHKVYFLDEESNKLNYWEFAHDEKLIQNQNFLADSLIIRKDVSLLESKFGFFNKESGEKKIYDNFFPKFFYHSHIIGNDKSSIYGYLDFQKIWLTDISDFGTYLNNWQEEKLYEVKKFIGVWNEQLVVQFTGGRFIGLSLNKGNILWDITEVKHNQTNQSIDYGFGDPYNPFLDEETGHIYMLQGEVLIDLDLNKLEASYVWNVKDLQLESYPFIRQSRMYDGKIYFTARSYINNDDDMVGVFNLSENKIVWQHIFDFDKGTFISNSQENIQVNSENLLVLDNKGTLYIFENE